MLRVVEGHVGKMVGNTIRFHSGTKSITSLEFPTPARWPPSTSRDRCVATPWAMAPFGRNAFCRRRLALPDTHRQRNWQFAEAQDINSGIEAFSTDASPDAQDMKTSTERSLQAWWNISVYGGEVNSSNEVFQTNCRFDRKCFRAVLLWNGLRKGRKLHCFLHSEQRASHCL